MYWRKISEAPKDGRTVLLAATLEPGQDVCVLGRWEDGHWIVWACDAPKVEPTHFCRWESPRTVAEVEEADAAATAARLSVSRYEDLCREVIRNCYWYYVKSSPLTTDQHFDRLFKLVGDIEAIGEVEVLPWSPISVIYGDQESQYPEWAKEKSC